MGSWINSIIKKSKAKRESKNAIQINVGKVLNEICISVSDVTGNKDPCSWNSLVFFSFFHLHCRLAVLHSLNINFLSKRTIFIVIFRCQALDFYILRIVCIHFAKVSIRFRLNNYFHLRSIQVCFSSFSSSFPCFKILYCL